MSVRRNELNDGDAEVTEPGLQPECRALQPAWKEVRRARHEAGERASTDAGQERQDHERRVARRRVLYGDSPADERDHEKQGCQSDEATGAHHRRQPHPHEAESSASQARHGGEPVELVLGDLEAEIGEARRDGAREEPGAEGQRQPERRDRQSAPGQFGVPNRYVLGIPVGQPLAAGAAFVGGHAHRSLLNLVIQWCDGDAEMASWSGCSN